MRIWLSWDAMQRHQRPFSHRWVWQVETKRIKRVAIKVYNFHLFFFHVAQGERGILDTGLSFCVLTEKYKEKEREGINNNSLHGMEWPLNFWFSPSAKQRRNCGPSLGTRIWASAMIGLLQKKKSSICQSAWREIRNSFAVKLSIWVL